LPLDARHRAVRPDASLALTDRDWLAIEQEYCRRSLSNFARQAWHVLEPTSDLKWGWALDAICDHLEAVTAGEINRLLMTVPPGSMKSLLTGVLWPAWEWGPKGLPQHRFIGTAHAQHLAVRDNMKCRRLIQSEWYQSLWPTELTTDQNAKTKFENGRTGFREAMAFTSMTGSRGDRVILDDPLSADNANSEVELESARITFTETLPTRVNNDKSAIVVIMQRLNERDTAGVILDMGLPYEHLCIPMRYEAGRTPAVSTIGYSDPRRVDGELMFPERFPEAQVAELERTLGSYGAAGQLQQRPAPRGGGMFKREWFEIIPAAPANCRWVRGWDLAATDSSEAAYTAGVLMGRTPGGEYIIADATRIQGAPAAVERLIVNTAQQDGTQVAGSIPQDPGQAGKSQALYLIRQLAGFTYRASPETGDKETRAQPLSAQAEVGNVKLVAGAWNRDFLDELSTFPVGKFKDQVDAASRAFSELVRAEPTRSIKVVR
jgi:predicted phage terminase large subunit-like protein